VTERDEEYQREPRAQDARQEELTAVVHRATDTVTAALQGFQPAILWSLSYGAIGLHPRHLVVWYGFDSDADQVQAGESGLTARIDELTRAELGRGGYPASAIPWVLVSFVSDETVQRETGGNYWDYFK
jgi:hypothetical protein